MKLCLTEKYVYNIPSKLQYIDPELINLLRKALPNEPVPPVIKIVEFLDNILILKPDDMSVCIW